jgi:hypothetical protein
LQLYTGNSLNTTKKLKINITDVLRREKNGIILNTQLKSQTGEKDWKTKMGIKNKGNE